jgi:hypothetical protein
MARPPEHPEDVALARKVLAGNAGVIALCPTPPLAGRNWPVVVRLGRALRLIATAPVGLVRCPGDAAVRDSTDREVPADQAYRLRELDDWNLVELILPRAPGLAEAARGLEKAVNDSRGKFAHLVIDYDVYVPEVPVSEVLDLPDAFVTAAARGLTRQRDLLAVVGLLPASRHLGTLLVEVESRKPQARKPPPDAPETA